MNQVPAVSCIQVPMAEMVLAIQRSRKSAMRRGAKPLGFSDEEVAGPALGASKGMARFS
jgi:hypothetical protein